MYMSCFWKACNSLHHLLLTNNGRVSRCLGFKYFCSGFSGFFSKKKSNTIQARAHAKLWNFALEEMVLRLWHLFFRSLFVLYWSLKRRPPISPTDTMEGLSKKLKWVNDYVRHLEIFFPNSYKIFWVRREAIYLQA